MKQTLFSFKFILPTLLIASIYLIFSTYLMNGSLVEETVFGSFPISYKVSLLLALLQGMWTTMSGLALIVFMLTALLTGANLTLLWQKINVLRHMKGLHLVVGGNSLLGIVGSGCAACGLPVLSLLGLSGSLIYWPLHGAELSYVAVILLTGSFYLLIKKSAKAQKCDINVNKKNISVIGTIPAVQKNTL